MEAYEGIMNSTRAPFSILPKPIDEDGNTVTTTGGADDDRYPLVPEEAMIVAAWQQLLNKAAAYPRSVLWNKVKSRLVIAARARVSPPRCLRLALRPAFGTEVSARMPWNAWDCLEAW